MPEQNLIDKALAPAQAPPNLIDSVLSAQQTPNLIDQAITPAPQTSDALAGAAQATAIGPRDVGIGERLENVVRNSAIGRAFGVSTAVSPQAQRPTIVQAMAAYQSNPQLKAQIDAHAAKSNIEPAEVLRQIVNTPLPESKAILNFPELVANRPGK